MQEVLTEQCIWGTFEENSLEKKKRNSMIVMGTWVMIGRRMFGNVEEASSSIGVLPEKTKIEHCDLLEVYSDGDKERLRDTVQENWSALSINANGNTSISDDYGCDDGLFTTENYEEVERLIAELKSSKTEKITLDVNNSSNGADTVVVDEEIDIDDI